LKLRFIDFEYNSTAEPKLNLVSYAQRLVDSKTGQYKDQTRWLHQCSGGVEPPDPKTAVLVAFNVIAEASALLSWGVNPLDYQWIDLQAEYRMLTNHNDEFSHGKQLIDGKVVTTLNPRKKNMNKLARFDRPSSSLASAAYKLLDVVVDTERKTRVRNLIIRNNPEEIEANKDEILEYNLSDVEYMPAMLARVIAEFTKAGVFNQAEMLERGSSVAHAAVMSMRGYPINYGHVRNFSQAVPDILKDVQEHINEQFPKMKVFEWDKKNVRYAMRQQPIKDWISKKSGKARVWPKTATGGFSLSFQDAWSLLYSFRSPYPEGDFAAQIYRYLRLKQALNGFIPKGANANDKTNFFSFVGRDRRVRAYLNPYGSQSSRFQPKAAGYLPLKPSWMRCFIEPPKGKAICGIDYKSQEFLIAGLLSDDRNMIDSYRSGDVYFDFAVKAKAVKRTADQKDPKVKAIRTKFKSTVLGIQYLMGPESLAAKLTLDTGIEHSVEEAETLVDLFAKIYKRFDRWRRLQITQYRKNKKLRLSDGWTLFGDNFNMRSVANCPVQGEGGAILRRAIRYAHDAGLKPIMPLHDALYIEFDERDFSAIDRFIDVMRRAFIDTFSNRPEAKEIKIDTYAFSPAFKHGEVLTPSGNSVVLMSKYLEGRGVDEYDRFSKYFIRS